jgi:hypothetical protein
VKKSELEATIRGLRRELTVAHQLIGRQSVRLYWNQRELARMRTVAKGQNEKIRRAPEIGTEKKR